MKCLICFFIHMDMPILIMNIFRRFILQSGKKGRMGKIKAIGVNFEMFSDVCFDLVFDFSENWINKIVETKCVNCLLGS